MRGGGGVRGGGEGEGVGRGGRVRRMSGAGQLMLLSWRGDGDQCPLVVDGMKVSGWSLLTWKAGEGVDGWLDDKAASREVVGCMMAWMG